MKLGIFSDTHDNIENTRRAIKYFNRNTDFVVHAGDLVSGFMVEILKELKCKNIVVFGNNEGNKERYFKIRGNKTEIYDGVHEFELDKKKIALYHGQEPSVTGMLLQSKNDVVITGHTHIPKIEKHGNLLHINPGSVAAIRDFRLLDRFSVAVYDTSSHSAEIIYFEKG